MKDFKPLLPLGRLTALERAMTTFLEAGVEDLRIVTGHRGAELEAVVTRLGGRVVHNRDYAAGMFSSVRAGVGTIGSEVDAFFVLPVDIPLVRPATIKRLIAARQQSPGGIIYPTFAGLRGHPPLIAAHHAGTIVAWTGNDGLRGVLGQVEAVPLEVAVADSCILRDMDSPDDYRRLTELVPRLDIPTPMECLMLLEQVLRVDQRIVCHGRQVARLATELAGALNRAGSSLDQELLSAAGLLHDLARHEPDHAMAGARLLREYGFAAVARLVASHMDLIVNERRPVGEAELLYLADKLVLGERTVSLTERLQTARSRFGHDADALRRLEIRLETARIIQRRCELQLGCPLQVALSGGDCLPVRHAG
jgi:CTP:molybdopterin cytidylyltransferase MocA